MAVTIVYQQFDRSGYTGHCLKTSYAGDFNEIPSETRLACLASEWSKSITDVHVHVERLQIFCVPVEYAIRTSGAENFNGVRKQTYTTK